jgi:hypothetical protein
VDRLGWTTLILEGRPDLRGVGGEGKPDRRWVGLKDKARPGLRVQRRELGKCERLCVRSIESVGERFLQRCKLGDLNSLAKPWSPR